MDPEELDKEINAHMLRLMMLIGLLPNSRNRSIAITHLEDANYRLQSIRN